MSAWYKAGSSRGSPPPVKAGEIIELQVYDDAGNPQGTILLGIRKLLPNVKVGVIVEAMFLGASDIYYHWWMNDSGQAPSKEAGLYHLCGVATKDCPPNSKYPTMVHGDRYRNLGGDALTVKQVSWLKDKALFDGFLINFGKFKAVLSGLVPTPKKVTTLEAEAEWPDERHPLEEGEDSGETYSDDESEDENMKSRIVKLRAELKKAEDDAAERKGRKKSGKKRRSSGVEVPGKDKKRRKKVEPPAGKDDRQRRREREKSPPVKDPKKVKKKRKRSSGSESDTKKKGGRSGKKRKPHPEESGDDSDSADGELFKSKKPLEAKAREADQDRGPFGGGAPVKFKGDETDESSSESSFRKGPSSSARTSQQRLLAYTSRHPGRLASRMLLKMEQATARGVEGPEAVTGNRTPPVAMNHVLTILLPSLGQKAGLRSTRELKTLGSILDHLARGNPSKAADVVAQRIKAVERASHESHWGSAQFLELLPPENSMLIEMDEEMYVTKEYLLDQKLREYDRRGGQRREFTDGKGKAKGAKGKTKDKEKGDRGAWDKNERGGKKPDA